MTTTKSRPVKLDRMRNLRYGINDVCLWESLMDKGFSEIIKTDLGFYMVRTGLYAGLRWEDPTITPEKIGDIMQDLIASKTMSLADINNEIGEALMIAGWIPQIKGVEEQKEGETEGN